MLQFDGVTVEVEVFDIAEIIGEAIEEPVEAKEGKQDIEFVVVEECARDAKDESEVHCVYTHVHDEIKGNSESETAFTTVEKCKKNLAINAIE